MCQYEHRRLVWTGVKKAKKAILQQHRPFVLLALPCRSVP
jgi:hypothetical protein